jgi:hypothetical protein
MACKKNLSLMILGEGKIRCHFWVLTELPVLLLDVTAAAQLQRPLAYKRGNNLKSPNPTEA